MLSHTREGNVILDLKDILNDGANALQKLWRQFDLFVDGRVCPARVLANIEGRDLIEYAVVHGDRILYSGLRWAEHIPSRPSAARPWLHDGTDLDYRGFTEEVLTELAQQQVQWIGREVDGDRPVPRPKLQLDDAACLRIIAHSDNTPVDASQATVRPFVLSDWGAATVLMGWTGDPVIVTWSGKPERRWYGIVEQVGEPRSHSVGLEVQRVEDSSEEAPEPGSRLSFDVGDVHRVYNRSRDSVLVNLDDLWDYRPTLAQTSRKMPFSADVNLSFIQQDIDDLVASAREGVALTVSTEEIVERWLAGGFHSGYSLGAEHYWLIHREQEVSEDGEEEDEVWNEWEYNGDSLFIYELVHSNGDKLMIAVETSTWDSFEGGPSWMCYDERLYFSLDEVEEVFGNEGKIERVL
jgi:hypothetical protein